MKIRREKVDLTIEKRMLIGLIVSDKVCREVLPALKLEYFQSDYASIVASWIMAYFEEYKKAPGRNVQLVFEEQSAALSESQEQVVEEFLGQLSSQYEEWSVINEDYVIDQAMTYIDGRSLLYLSDQIRRHVNVGDYRAGKAAVSTFRKVLRQVDGWVKPFDSDEIINAMDEESSYLFQLPGVLGKMLGPFKRGYFVAFAAPVKRGKTWMLMEIAIRAMVSRLRVAFISLEMRKERVEQRIYRRVLSAAGKGGLVYYPVFDCLNNQDDSCSRRERLGRGKLIDGDGNVPEFDPRLNWTHCSACRESQGGGDYVASFVPWFVGEERPEFGLKPLRRLVDSARSAFNLNNFMLRSYPRFSANVNDIMRDLEILEYVHGFVPDVIVVDYADILRKEVERDETREMVNETWMTLAQLAEVRKCLVVTATQSNRRSWDAVTTRGSDTGEDYRKLAHVDIMCTISQTPDEKDRGVLRVGVAAHRDEEYNERRQVTLLQNLSAGQPLLDSGFVEYSSGE